ncbi:hypothetical protein B0T19DRAFT_269619 [Cercophora scortea]|uniref:Rhodopsin domain-containing protein n=1 Tax=Cercophora scortea TaxID=314031 RepID=A0AAE0M6E5_9PEZI|nr:hypothetical protein B0T19DRAFT_269619 [Cercophora scortea]
MSAVSSTDFFAAMTASVVLPMLFVGIRLLNNYGLRKRFLADDWFSILGLVFLVVIGVLYSEMRVSSTGEGRKATLEDMGRMTVAIGFIASFGAYFAKVPILILYLRLFGVYTYLRNSCYILLAVPLLLLAGSASYGAALCSPDNKVMDTTFLVGCVRSGLGVCVWNAAVSLAADILIFVLPLPVIFGITLPRRKKIGLVVIFLVGILGVTAGAVALYFRAISLAGFGTSSTNVGEMLGPVIECSIAIMVGCVPAVSSFWRRHLTGWSLPTKLSSIFSAKCKKSQPGGSFQHISDPQIVVESSVYVVFDKPRPSGLESITRPENVYTR